MKVALLLPPHAYKTQKEFGEYPFLPGIAYIEAALRESGHDVKVFDLKYGPKSFDQFLEEASGCEVIGVPSLIDCYNFFREALPELKRRGHTIVVGGPLISSYGRNENNLLMRVFPEIDFGVIGEGERTVQGLMGKLSGQEKEYPGGLVYRTGETLRTTGNPQRICNLDELPEIDYSRWPDFSRRVENDSTGLITARGCPNSCGFCYKVFPGVVRSFSFDRIERELKKISKLKPKFLFLHDDSVTYDQERFAVFANLLKKYNLAYGIETRIDETDRDLLKLLKETGCIRIDYGIESFNPELLKEISKNITVEQIYRTIRETKEEGIDAHGFFIVGLPGESRKTIEETLKGISKTKLIPRARIFIPLPGTRIYQDLVEQGRIDEIQLLKDLSIPNHFDTTEGNWVPINLSDGLTNQELLDARDRMNAMRTR